MEEATFYKDKGILQIKLFRDSHKKPSITSNMHVNHGSCFYGGQQGTAANKCILVQTNICGCKQMWG